MFELKYVSGQKVNVAIRYFGTTLGEFVPLDLWTSDPDNRKMYLALSAGTVECIIEEFDNSDNTYRVKPVNDSTNYYFWTHFDYITGQIKSNGCTCIECKEHYYMAEPNFETDKLVCYTCVTSRGWKYTKINGIVTLNV